MFGHSWHANFDYGLPSLPDLDRGLTAEVPVNIIKVIRSIMYVEKLEESRPKLLISPLPTKNLGLHAIRLSVHLSIRQSDKSVFRNFFSVLPDNHFHILYIALS